MAPARNWASGTVWLSLPHHKLEENLNPNNAIVALLQMRSDKLVSRDYVRRELPVEINISQEEQKVDIEEMRDALRVAVAQYAQAVPTLAAQGQDVSLVITRIADVIKGRQKGLMIESVIEKAFAPAEPAPGQMPTAQGQPPISPAAGAVPTPASQPQTPQQGGATPAAGPQAPQGKPDIASLLASIGGAA